MESVTGMPMHWWRTTGVEPAENRRGSVMDRVGREPTWPLLGILAAAALFLLAALQYPGGYDWSGQSISSLFQPLALNGNENGARPIAVVAVLFFCVAVGAAFERISRRSPTRVGRKVIQIAGIGSMVYAFLVVTPMHDVLVGVALLFFLVAMLATFHMLWVEGRGGMLVAGVLCMSGTVWNAAMYYGPMEAGFLPVVQKLSTFLWVGWLFVLYFSARRPLNAAATTPPPESHHG